MKKRMVKKCQNYKYRLHYIEMNKRDFISLQIDE